jgi:co-chaperonin GroES (HSP10)
MSIQKVQILSAEFKPKNEYLLVKPTDLVTEVVTESGLVISLKPQSSLERPTSGTVISVGSDIKDIEESDFVLWPMTDGLDLEFLDGQYVLLRYKSIIGSKKK